MRSLVYEGENKLAIKDRDVPKIGDGEALIRVSYTGICGTDILVWHGGLQRVNPPVTLGHEFSGVIEQINNQDSEYKVGDRVVVEPLLTCKKCLACRTGHYNACTSLKLIGIDTDGAMAKYVKVPEEKLFRLKPTTLMEDASFVEPLAVGVHMVEQSKLCKGETALVIGGGPIGLITASVAKLTGAQVYISEINPYRIEKAQELGFSTINPKEESLEKKIKSVTDGEGAAVTFEVTGTAAGAADMTEVTCTQGRIVIAGLPKKPPVVDLYKIVAKELKVIGSRVYTNKDYSKALYLIESGQFTPKDLITGVIELDEAIAKGFESVVRGDPAMKILIDLENEV
jgi:(R,R)-butanediol dehydrogenase/meso-butanediol dehydrogenase/diacetyl reductase